MIEKTIIRDATETDIPVILALNEEFVQYLSPMDAARLQILRSMAVYLRVVECDGVIAGFLLAFGQGSAYDSTNYQWFNSRYADFLYIDRVVIAAGFQGKQLGRLMYDDLAAYGAARKSPFLACEYNIKPMNEGSRKFHAAYGFTEVGTKWSDGDTRQVSMQTFPLVV